MWYDLFNSEPEKQSLKSKKNPPNTLIGNAQRRPLFNEAKLSCKSLCSSYLSTELLLIAQIESNKGNIDYQAVPPVSSLWNLKR